MHCFATVSDVNCMDVKWFKSHVEQVFFITISDTLTSSVTAKMNNERKILCKRVSRKYVNWKRKLIYPKVQKQTSDK